MKASDLDYYNRRKRAGGIIENGINHITRNHILLDGSNTDILTPSATPILAQSKSKYLFQDGTSLKNAQKSLMNFNAFLFNTDRIKLEETLGSSQESEETMSEIVGSLSFFVVREPKSFFEGLKEPDRYLSIDLTGDEWGALFYDVLKCPKATVEPFSSGEDPEQWRERYRLKFQQAIPNYPMLSRIWDLYNYASYRPEEIVQLREECLKVQTNTSNEKGLAALVKLVAACDEASKLGSGLLFVPD